MTSESRPTGKSTLVILLTSLLTAGWTMGADITPVRVSHVEGAAAYEPAGEVDWSEVTVNLPLLSGDRIISNPGSRVEIELGYHNFLRLDERADVVLQRISGDEVDIDLKTGPVILRIYDSERYRIYTPDAVVRVHKKGLYRITVRENGETTVAVRKGIAEVENNFRSRKVRSGEELIVSGPQSALSQLSVGYREDDFDFWSDRRDALYVTDTSVRYVGHRAGAYDLDRYGYWDSIGSYGSVWFPHVGAGWAPYRAGRWCHYPGYGWTWIAYEPWGWLPYHHGNWVYYRPYRRWCWVPGGFGSWFGARVNFFFGGGYVGWAPYGYGYGHRNRGWGSGGVTVVNNNTNVVNNNTTVINRWNLPDRDGLTVVHQDDFVQRSPDRVLVANPSRRVIQDFSEGLPQDLSRGAAPRRPLPERNTRVLTTAGAGSSPAASVDRGSRGANVVVIGNEPRRQESAPAAGASSPGRTSSWTVPGRSQFDSGASRPETSSTEDRRVLPQPQQPAPNRQGERENRGSRWTMPSRPAAPSDESDRTRRALPPRTQVPTVRPDRPEAPTTRPSARPPGGNRSVAPPRSGDQQRRWTQPSRGPGVRPERSRSDSRVTRPSSRPSRSVSRPQPSRSRPTTSPSRGSRPSYSRPPASRPSRSTSPPRPKPRPSKPPGESSLF